MSQAFFVEDVAGPAAWTANGQSYMWWCDNACFDFPGLSYAGNTVSADAGPFAITSPPGWYVNAVGASPDGQHIAFVGAPGVDGAWGEGPNYLYTANTDGTNVIQLTSATGFSNQVTYSPDGTIIAIDHGFINSDGTEYETVPGCPCAFAATPTTFSTALSALPRLRIYRHAPERTTAAVRRLQRLSLLHAGRQVARSVRVETGAP